VHYLLILRNGSKLEVSISEFNAWVTSYNEQIGHDFSTRLAQLRRFTSEDILDWTMEEGIS
jgi:hypothetical protein